MPIKIDEIPKIETLEEGQAVIKYLVERFNKLEQESQSEIAKLRDEIASLKKNSETSSKPPSSDIVKPQPKGNRRKKRKRGGQPGRDGTHRARFSSEEVDQIKIIPATTCPDCKVDLELLGSSEMVKQQVIELPEKPVIITEYHREAVLCPCCGLKRFGQLPTGVIEGQLLGLRFQSLVGYMKGFIGMSYLDMRQFCADVFEVELSTGTLANTVKQVSNALKSPYQELESNVPQQRTLNIDETGWRDSGDRYWVWIFCNTMIAFFTIRSTRSAQVLRDVLNETFSGAIISDFYSAYVSYANAVQQYCLAHLIRDIKFLTTLTDEASKIFGERVLFHFKKFFELWHERHNEPPEKIKAKVERRKRKLLKYLVNAKFPKGKAETMRKRLIKHWDNLFRFFEHPDLCEPTNNQAERDLRLLVKIRKLCQGTNSSWGRDWIARFMTVHKTCKKRKLNTWTFLQQSMSAYCFGTKYPSLVA